MADRKPQSWQTPSAPAATSFPGKTVARARHLLGDRAVIGGRSHDRDILKFFAAERIIDGPPMSDVLDQLLEVNARFGRGLLKGIQVDHHHVDGRDAMLCNGRAMAAIFAAMENASVHLRMQRFDAPGRASPGTRSVRKYPSPRCRIRAATWPCLRWKPVRRRSGEFVGEILPVRIVGDAKNGTLEF